MPLVTYIGSKPKKEDNVTRSAFVWGLGESLNVPVEIAAKLIQFPDVWVLAEGESLSGQLSDYRKPPEPEEEQENPMQRQVPLVDLQTLDRDGLMAYAQKYFNLNLDARWKEDTMRQKILGELHARQRFG